MHGWYGGGQALNAFGDAKTEEKKVASKNEGT